MSEVLQEKPITTAVIPMAGYGTRMLPATKAVPKPLLTIGDRTVADYVMGTVVDAQTEGVIEIDQVVLVVSPEAPEIRKHFGRNIGFETYLLGKLAAAEGPAKEKIESQLDMLSGVNRGMRIRYVKQRMMKHGTAVPVRDAMRVVPDGEQFIVLMGDNFPYRTDGGSDNADLAVRMRQGGQRNGMLVSTVSDEEVHKYGIVETDADGNMTGVIEKPQAHETDSRAFNISDYILDKEMLAPVIRNYVRRKLPHEYYLTDVVTELAAQSPFLVHEIQGEYMDAGSKEGLLQCWKRLVGNEEREL